VVTRQRFFSPGFGFAAKSSALFESAGAADLEIALESGARVRGVGDFEARAEFLVICARAA